jgi:hypothetical protein
MEKIESIITSILEDIKKIFDLVLYLSSTKNAMPFLNIQLIS